MVHNASKIQPAQGQTNKEMQGDVFFDEEYMSDELFFDTSYGLVYDDGFGDDVDLFSQTLEQSSLTLTDKVNMDDELIFMDLSDIISNDTVYSQDYDEDANLDILLGSKDAVHSVKDMFSNNEHAYMEMAVLGDNIQGHNMQEMLHGIGITKNTDGSIHLDQGWQASAHNGNFSQYIHAESDTTLFVHQTLIVTGS